MADVGPHSSYRNWTSLIGAALTTVSAALFLVFFFLDVIGFHTNPYLGIVTFLVLPTLFVLGLLLIPFGLWRARRAVARGRPLHEWPSIDLAKPHVRRTVVLVLVLTCVNVAIIAMAAASSVEYVDSKQFCTSVCHTPMEPEAVAHQRSVHASISCTSCHVGPGAEGFVRAKLGGVRRLLAVTTGSYQRPVPAPVHDLPEAVGTCRSCHTPTKYFGELVRSIPYYSDDEGTTEQITTLTMRLGGGGFEAGGPAGIHWHASPLTRVEYIATGNNRETIPWVQVSDTRGVREYVAEGATPEQLAGERRVMDCTDCHNRIGHNIAATPDRAVDGALARGVLPRSLPFIRRETLAAVSVEYPDRAAAEQQIAARLTAFYAQQPHLAADPRVTQAVRAAQEVYTGNVFPHMNVKWGSYPNNLGHTDAPGCFRCHDDQHKAKSGAVITQDCEGCHRMQ
jgi:hypothetical protein